MAGISVILRRLRGLIAAQMAEGQTDALLLEQFVAQRDEMAFAALLERHGPMVLGVCRRVLHDEHRAEDVFQATFLVLVRKASSIRKQQSISSWLHGVALRLAHRAKAEAARSKPLDMGDYLYAAVNVSSETSWHESREILDEELQRLPENYRLPLVLCYLEGLTRDEAAVRLGWTANKLRGFVERGRERLRARLIQRGVTLSAAGSMTLLADTILSAAVPPLLSVSTMQAAAQFAAGTTLTACGISGPVVALTQGALTMMALKKLTVILTLTLCTAIIGSGVGFFAHRPEPVEAKQPSAPPTLAVAQDLSKKEEPKAARVDRLGDPLPDGALLRLGTLRHRLLGHYGSRDMYLADGKTALTRTSDEIRWVNLHSGLLAKSWPLPDKLTVSGFSPDGRWTVLFDKKTLQLWDLTTLTKVLTFRAKGDLGIETEAQFSADDKVVSITAVSPPRGVNLDYLRVFDRATGEELWGDGKMKLREMGLSNVGFLPDNKTLVVLDHDDSKISLRDCRTGQVIRTFDTLAPGDRRQWGLSPDGKTVFFGTAGNTVRCWDIASGKELPPLGNHVPQAYRFAVSGDSKTVLTGGSDGTVLVWDWPAAKLRTKIALGAGRGPGDMRVTAAGDRAEIIVSGDSARRLFDLKTGKELTESHEGHRAPVYGVAVTADRKVVSTGFDGTVGVWDLRSGRKEKELTPQLADGSYQLILSPDGKSTVAVSESQGQVFIYDRATNRLVHTIDTGGRPVRSVAFQPQGKLLAIQALRGKKDDPGMGYTLIVWDIERAREAWLKPGLVPHAFSPDSQILAVTEAVVGGANDKIHLLEAATGRHRLSVLQKGVTHVEFSPDGRRLAAESYERLSLWELAAPEKECWGMPATWWTRAARFSPDGRSLAHGDKQIVNIHDVFDGRKARSFAGHDMTVEGLAFAPDGSTLVSASFDTTLLVWDITPLSASRGKFPSRPDASALQTAWKELASADPKAALHAIRILTEGGAASSPILRENLKLATAPHAKVVQRLLADLDSARFAERSRAAKELTRLADLVESALKEHLTRKLTVETRRRAEAVLADIQGPITDPARLQALRAVEALEFLGTREARQVLGVLAKGTPAGRLTQEAKNSLDRLETRRSAK